MEDKNYIRCDKDCYFFKYVNVGGRMYKWCFHKCNNGLIDSTKFAKECIYFCDTILDFGLSIDELPRNQKEQRNKKIKQKSKVFRYHYSIRNKVAHIISKFDHWILILSNNEEHLFHQNIGRVAEYADVMLLNPAEFHLHKVLRNEPMAIQQMFEIIENHDIYVLKNRYHASIKKQMGELMHRRQVFK